MFLSFIVVLFELFYFLKLLKFTDISFPFLQGGQVPPPLMSFEATGFPPELLREV